MSPNEIMRPLVRERGKALTGAMRALGLALVLTFWLANPQPELVVTIALINVAVPVVYVNFALAGLIWVGLVGILSYFVLNEFVRLAGNRLFRFHAPWMLTLVEDGASAWSLALLQQFRFFESDKPHRLLAAVSAMLVGLPFLVVLILYYWTVFHIGGEVAAAHGLLSLEAALTLVSWLLVIFPIVYAILLAVPFSFRKNTRYIRWNFLYPLYARSGLRPPRVRYWHNGS